ncbi:c-type cytochrome [Kriegella sp. EG-1]|nr:c-type cytochrome [Flavobacteriaceae bacterium EG-1]
MISGSLHVILPLLLIAIVALGFCLDEKFQGNENDNSSMEIYTKNYNVSRLNDSDENRKIKKGFEVFRYTSKFIGPKKKGGKFSGNNLSCANCHLWSGTKPYAAPLIGIIQRFPQFRGRENKIGTIVERVNGCMERSMNGIALPTESEEMLALIAYMNWLSRFAPADGKIKGQGFVQINIPSRAVNLTNGKKVFNANCIVCHEKNGQGKWLADSIAYEFPPLWGSDSYNNGAGMTRVITAAQFIKANMPYGATYENPILTDDEAYDVAGYINQQERPEKKNKEVDFPDIKKKPVSTPYPPYADTFSVKQHQLGPFSPIKEYYKKKYNIVKSK